MAKLEIVKILLFQQKQHKNERELLYIPRTTIINFISLICLTKYEFEKVLICQRFNDLWRHVIAVCLRLSLRNLTALIMDTPRSTPRTQNWSKDEVLRLLRLVKERKDIIKGKFSPILTIKHERSLAANHRGP